MSIDKLFLIACYSHYLLFLNTKSNRERKWFIFASLVKSKVKLLTATAKKIIFKMGKQGYIT